MPRYAAVDIGSNSIRMEAAEVTPGSPPKMLVSDRQVTRLGGANFAPFFHPDGKRIIFASNQPDPRSRNFDLYLVNLDGTGLERVTTSTEFDGFPMFSPDGKRLVFASNRHAAQPGETNIFVAEWVE